MNLKKGNERVTPPQVRKARALLPVPLHQWDLLSRLLRDAHAYGDSGGVARWIMHGWVYDNVRHCRNASDVATMLDSVLWEAAEYGFHESGNESTLLPLAELFAKEQMK